MERNEILKKIGFSEQFLESLDNYDKEVPVVEYEVPFYNEEEISVVNFTNTFTLLHHNNDNYNHSLIVTSK